MMSPTLSSPPLAPAPVSVQAGSVFASGLMAAAVASTPVSGLRIFPIATHHSAYLPSPIMTPAHLTPLASPEQTEPLDLTVRKAGPGSSSGMEHDAERVASVDSALDLSGRQSTPSPSTQSVKQEMVAMSTEMPGNNDLVSSMTPNRSRKRSYQVKIWLEA